tara:strand:+ start:135183 stop:136667 length:1485 start_codon:yes stop_codon:yes gene_type:complete
LGKEITNSSEDTGEPTRFLAERTRRRDFVVLGLIVLGILGVLFISGTLDVSEVFTAFLIFCFAGLAFYLSTEPDARGYQGEPVKAAGTVAPDSAKSGPATRPGAFREELLSVISAYPEPALLTGFDGRIVASNELAADVFRLPRHGIGLGSSIIRRPDVLAELEKISKGLMPDPLEIEVTGTPDQYFRVSLQPLTLMGETMVLIALDELTELRRAEKARADFLANASHELRTPLTSLAGFIETMRGPAKDDPESWDRFLEIMYGQTERMRRLIHDLLSLSRIELNEHLRPNQKVDLALVVAEGVEALVPVARDKGLELELIQSAETAPIYAVRDEMVQVIQNLIDNALKYSPDGTAVRVEVSAGLDLEQARTFAGRRWPNAARISIVQSRPDPKARFAVFRVSDEGQGIDREHLPRLGERFYRVDEGRDRSVGGTGLGLAIVKHIVARHRGGLMVESEMGRGSAFGIWLPLTSQSSSVPEPVPRDEDKTLPSPD